MAALRSGMAMLGRRSGGLSGSSSAATMGIHQVLRPAPPPLRPAAVHNLKSWRRFSTGGGESKSKAESIPRLAWQWAKYHVPNVSLVTESRVIGVYVMVAMGTPLVYMVNTIRNWRPSP